MDSTCRSAGHTCRFEKRFNRKSQNRQVFDYQSLESRQLLAAQPLISEFVASNDGGLVNDNGNTSDWIEIYNAGDEAIDLVGHTLTDNSEDIEKWTFPSYVLEPGRYLIVYADVDDDPNQGSDLYTGFRLNASGEFLGFYDPSGAVLSAFENTDGSEYPPQLEDVSYGPLITETMTIQLVEGGNSEYLVPNATTGPLLGNLWQDPDYILGSNGENWQTGASGFGYERGSGFESFIATDVESELYDQGTSLYIRSTINQSPGDPIDTLRLRARYDDGFVAYLNGEEVARGNVPGTAGSNPNRVPLGNLFDDAPGTDLQTAIATDTYVADAQSSDLGIYTVITGGMNVARTIAPGVSFNFSNVGGGSGQAGGPSNDTFRAGDNRPISTTGQTVGVTSKIEDGVGMHANALVTFDLDEIRTAGNLPGVDGYFSATAGLNDTAAGAGSIYAIVVLSDNNGQVIAGYVNGQQVDVSNNGSSWSFGGSIPSLLSGAGNTRLAQFAVPVPRQAAYLSLVGTGGSNLNSDHVVFSGATLDLNVIPIGNLFDDPASASVSDAVATDTRGASADVSDLGIEAVGNGAFNQPQAIAPQVSFDFSNVSSSISNAGEPTNDVVSVSDSSPIRTRGVSLGGLAGATIEDGVGLAANGFVTLNLNELKSAGGLNNAAAFRFVARASINDSSGSSGSGHAIAIVSDSSGNVTNAWVNGQSVPVLFSNEIWSLDANAGLPNELTRNGDPVDFDIEVNSDAAFLTLAGVDGQFFNSADEIVLSGARLIAARDPDGVEWDAVSGNQQGDANAVIQQEFDFSDHVHLLRDGSNVLAIQVVNRSTTSSDLLLSHEIVTGSLNFNLSQNRYYATPTPGSANGESFIGLTDDTKFSIDRGFYDDPISVAITTDTPGANIYYTTDFSLPGPDNPTSTLYSSEVLIDQTTNLRAVAIAPGFAPSNVDTQTYIFLEDVLQQDPKNVNGNGVSPDNGLAYPDKFDNNVDADYAIDPEVLAQWDDNNPANDDFGIRESLLSLPTFSLTLDHGDAFRPVTDPFPGIVTDATKRGEGFRHAASIEYFDPNTGESFQENAAVQAQGNSSRSSGSTRQHSYRLIFDGTLDGPNRLNYPLFDNSDFADINTFTLKVASTDGFSHDSRTNGSHINPLNSTYTRDAFIRQLHFNTGNPAADSTFAHVYINGLYWGLYTPIERPDDAWFSSRFGGQREDWDIFRDNDEFLSGNSIAWNQMVSLISSIGNASSSQADALFQQLQGKNSDGSNNPTIDALMDVDNFIDYYMIHMSNNAVDWPVRNWYAGRNRVDPGDGFQFIAWDQGQSLDQSFVDRTERQGGLGTLHRRLRNSPEYRLRFADRIQKHFFNDGALTLEAKQQTWTDLASQAEKAIVAETARWGDSREGEFSNPFDNLNAPIGAPTHPTITPGVPQNVPTLTIDNWRINVNFVHDEVLPFTRGLFFDRMLEDGLMNSVSVPTFQVNGSSQHGGAVGTGSTLAIDSSDTVYFTIDGGDPRAVGGGISGQLYSGSFTINRTTTVKARARTSGGQWSALSEATFVMDSNSIVISEINYNPHDARTAFELALPDVDNDDFEFVEILNTSTTETVNLQGMQLSGAVDFVFPNVILSPGQRVLVVEDATAFGIRYGFSNSVVVGQWTGGLSNSGEELELVDALGETIMSVNYGDGDPWPIAADGAGSTLVLADESSTPANRLGKYYSWRASYQFGGSPGVESATGSSVVINEILANPNDSTIDQIELYNASSLIANVGDWYVGLSDHNLLQYQIPSNTTIPANGYLVLDRHNFVTGGGTFELDTSGGEVFLSRAATNSLVLRIEDAISFGGSFLSQTLGRWPDGSGRFVPLTVDTLGEENASPAMGPLLISEVNYHPSDPTPSALNINPGLTDNDLEFIEITNPTLSAISLEQWRLRGESDYDFEDGTTLGPSESLIVVGFDPESPGNISKLAAFEEHYGSLLSASAPILGPFNRNLNNGSARVTLQQPDLSTSSGNLIHVVADEVVYDDLTPWADADANGSSLNRNNANANGNLASSWTANLPTPGSSSLVGATAPQVISAIRDEGGILRRPDLLNTLTIRFDQNVSLSSNALELINSSAGGTSVDLNGIGFTYDPSSFVATWDFSVIAPLDAGYYRYQLVSSSVQGTTSGLELDGNLNGDPGGDFEQQVYVAIPGDSDLNGSVSIVSPGVGDAFVLVSNLGMTSGAGWADGDFNGDGQVNVLGDAFQLISNIGRNVLPPEAISTAIPKVLDQLQATSSINIVDSVVQFESENWPKLTTKQDRKDHPRAPSTAASRKNQIPNTKQKELSGSIKQRFKDSKDFDDAFTEWI